MSTMEDRVWEKFLDENPEYIEGTKHRQYGDYVFGTKYADSVERGELSYAAALDLVVRDVVNNIGPPDQSGEYHRTIDDLRKTRMGCR